MSAKEWQKVVFVDEKEFNLGSPDGFQNYWHAKIFPEKKYSTKNSGGVSYDMMVGAISSSGKLQLQFVSGWQKVADYVKILKGVVYVEKNGFFSKVMLLSTMHH